MKLYKRSMVICLLFFLLGVGTSPPLQAAQGGEKWGKNREETKNVVPFSDIVAMSVIIAGLSYTTPQVGGGYLFLSSGMAALSGDHYSLAAFWLAVSAYDVLELPREYERATTVEERSKVKRKSFWINFTAMSAWILMNPPAGKMNPEQGGQIQMQTTSFFFLTPYEDTFALNYHLRF